MGGKILIKRCQRTGRLHGEEAKWMRKEKYARGRYAEDVVPKRKKRRINELSTKNCQSLNVKEEFEELIADPNPLSVRKKKLGIKLSAPVMRPGGDTSSSEKKT